MSVEQGDALSLPELTDDEIIDIFTWTDPSAIPAEFIHLAKLITPLGQILYLDGAEYRAFVDSHPTGTFVGKVELALDLDRFGKDVKAQTEKILLGKGTPVNDYFSFNGDG